MLAFPQLGPRFKVDQRLGETSHFDVFSGQQEGAAGFSRQVLIKVLRPEHSQDRQVVKAFAEQARTAALFAHPNILHLYDFGEHAGAFFLVTEFLDGYPLATVLAAAVRANRSLSPGFLAAVGSQVCAGLGYAHDRPGPNGAPLALVHRDLNPTSIAACADGTAKLLDFSLARAAGFAPYTETLRGNLAYASPEQFSPAPVDPRSDLFSLATVLWELAARRRLAAVADPAHLSRWISEVPAPKLRTIDPSFPEELAAIVERALEIDPANRFASATEMGRALDAFLAQVGATPSEEIRAELLRARIGGEPSPVPAPDAPTTTPPWRTTGSGSAPLEPAVELEESEPLELAVTSVPLPAAPPAPVVPTGPLTRHRLPERRFPRGAGLVLALVAALGAAALLYLQLRPAPPAPARITTILITSDPAGASVQIDGAVVGTTPYSVQNTLPPGPHPVQLDKEGFAATRASVQGGQQTWLALELKPIHMHTRPPTPASP